MFLSTKGASQKSSELVKSEQWWSQIKPQCDTGADGCEMAKVVSELGKLANVTKSEIKKNITSSMAKSLPHPSY